MPTLGLLFGDLMIRTVLITLLAVTMLAPVAHAQKDPCRGVRADGATRTYEGGGLVWRTSGDVRTLQLDVSKPVGFMAALRKKTERELPDLKAGSSISVTLGDGSTQTLVSGDDAAPSVAVVMGALINHYVVSVSLSADEWDQIAAHGITKAQLVEDADYGLEPSARAVERFAEAGRCIAGG
jgi:hypothetical protein